MLCGGEEAPELLHCMLPSAPLRSLQEREVRHPLALAPIMRADYYEVR